MHMILTHDAPSVVVVLAAEEFRFGATQLVATSQTRNLLLRRPFQHVVGSVAVQVRRGESLIDG